MNDQPQRTKCGFFDCRYEPTEGERLIAAIEWIRDLASYHMVRHPEGRDDRMVLGEIKEHAIAVLRECGDA